MDAPEALRSALAVFHAPLTETLETFSGRLQALIPHAALANHTSDCMADSLHTQGDVRLTTRITVAELEALHGRAVPGEPWTGRATLAGGVRELLLLASTAAGSGQTLLAVVPERPVSAEERELAQILWDLATVHLATLVSRQDPDALALSLAVAEARARTAADQAERHTATLTALLGVLRSRSLDDAAARRAATDATVAALLETDAPPDDLPEPLPAAFARLRAELEPLLRHSALAIELVPPADQGSPLHGRLAETAVFASRAAVLLVQSQPDVRRARLAWRTDGAVLRIELRDDGPGLLSPDDPAVVRLTTRLSLLGGAFELDPVPGWGTVLAAVLPLAPRELPDAAPLTGLAPRELQVLGHLGRGLRNREIAQRMQLSEHTVKFHVGNLFTKLGVRTRGEAAALARGSSTIYR
ncbi:response regulator transcription factor [Actinocorallia lasiicapitis]